MSGELDIERPADLLNYLRERRYVGSSEIPELCVLQGGVSNRTVMVTRESGEQWVLKQALEKLRVPVEWLSRPERIHREADGIRWLLLLAPEGTITPLVFEDNEHHLLAMQAVPQPHENWKTMLLRGEVNEDHVVQFGTLLGMIHRRGRERLHEISRAFEDRSFFDSLRLEPYYRYTAEQVPASRSFYESLLADTWATRATLVHGDYSPKNMLVHQSRLILLDHEVIHFGDPAFDHGFALTHLLSKAHHLPKHRGQFANAARLFWTSYCDAAGELAGTPNLEERAVRHTLGCLLARVAGRSPLEYLSATEQACQKEAALSLMDDRPGTVGELTTSFISRV